MYPFLINESCVKLFLKTSKDKTKRFSMSEYGTENLQKILELERYPCAKGTIIN